MGEFDEGKEKFLQVVKSIDPIGRYPDAAPPAGTESAPARRRGIVVLASCRGAVEAACQRLTRSGRVRSPRPAVASRAALCATG